MSNALRIHPENPKLFEFRGKPLVLLTASEHYGAVMNRPFDFARYLADASDKHMTLSRLFVLFRELQTPINPYSTCKPESPDYIAPYARTGPGRAHDGELKFDLDKPNPEFYDRLHRYLSLAAHYGILVEIVLLSNTYVKEVWQLNPLHADNNLNGLEACEWPEYTSQQHPLRFARQAEHVRRIVTEANRYDNLFYEICNEPGGGVKGKDSYPSPEAVNEWLRALIGVVRQTEAGLPNQHLIAGGEAFSYATEEQNSDLTPRGMPYDVVNVHAAPKAMLHGRRYNLGNFMGKQLMLRDVQAFGLAAYADPKPLNQDEDNTASQYKDVEAWTIHRKRAWTVLMTGGHYDYIDFSIINYSEAGTENSRRYIRSWFKYLSQFIHSFDLARARPLPELVAAAPEHALPSAFGVPGEDFAIYLADEREVAAARDLPDGDNLERGAGQPISGRVTLNLPAGSYEIAGFDPKTGEYAAATPQAGGGAVTVEVPAFREDWVMRVTKV
jgi:hypothetical protein